MVLNDSFSSLLSSPSSLRKANDSFNESFGDKTSLSPTSIFRYLQKEHDQISSVLRSCLPTTSQYQSSINELINLFERAEDQSSVEFQKLILSVFLKLTANILTVLRKPKHQPILYKMAQLIAVSIVPDLGPDNEIEEKSMKKWADRIAIECYIHLIDAPVVQLDRDFSIEGIVDDLGLASGRFQFVKSSIFFSARDMASQAAADTKIELESKFSLENLPDEHFLRLILWLCLRQKSILKDDGLLSSLFSRIPLTMTASEYVKSSECSQLDVKLYIISLSVVSSTTTETGMTVKSQLSVPSQLSLTKHQKDCWKAVVDACAGKPVAALSRLRTSQLIESVRLISDGAEDVRVLFEAWKHCLQPSATHDDNVHEAIQVVTEKYRNKMNSLLAYGEGYMSLDEVEKGDDVLGVDQNESFGNETFHSFATASEDYSSGNNSQFFSPLKNNRDSMLPSAVAQLIRDESIANTSHISTKSLIMTPTRSSAASAIDESSKKRSELSFERHQTVNISGDDEEDELEAALLESTKKHERSLLASKTPEKASTTPKTTLTPMKDAQTETDDAALSSEESSIISVRYTPKKDIKTKETPAPVFSQKDESEFEDEYDEDDEEDEYESDEEQVETENEEDDDCLLDESQMEDMLEQLLEATVISFRDIRMKKLGIETEKIQFENATDEEIVQKAQLKLEKINKDLSATYERIYKLSNPAVSTLITHTTTAVPTMQLIQSLETTSNTIGHDSKSCIGCQLVPE
uniref:Telomere length regulation protein n=1 Tax=Caenorhabditis tropicalis TaxID=1561998 RepID=A0A1I7UY45_9PELO